MFNVTTMSVPNDIYAIIKLIPTLVSMSGVTVWMAFVTLGLRCDVVEVTQDIEKADDRIKACFYQVDQLEKKLRSRELTEDDRDKLQNELEVVKKTLAEHERTLKTLHKENSKTFMITAIIVFFAFLVYGVYIMWKRG